MVAKGEGLRGGKEQRPVRGPLPRCKQELDSDIRAHDLRVLSVQREVATGAAADIEDPTSGTLH